MNPVILLVPMSAAEFERYVERAVPAFARDKIDSGQWSVEEALALARRVFDEVLADGIATPDHFLLTVRDAATGVAVGAVWYAIQERAGQRVAFVYDVLVEPSYRRMGYATGIFEALRVEVRARGLRGIALHVFGHNTAARALYAKLGYRATNIEMFEALPAT